MGRKIAVVGASMEGFLQLALLVHGRRYYGPKHNLTDDEYVLIHDPDKVYPFMMTGAGTVFFETLEREIFLTKRWMQKYADAALEGCGYKYIGWGNRRDKNFFTQGCNLTFDIEKFRQEFVTNGGDIFGPNVSIVETRIDSFEEVEDGIAINGDKYDYVIDCCDKQPLGWDLDYHAPSVEVSNSAIVFEKTSAGNFNYTMDYAAKYGHIIGLPHRTKQLWSYCYDSKLCTEDDIRADFASIFPEEVTQSYKSWSISWTPKVSNYVVHPVNGRYIRNGYSLINIEPSTISSSEFSDFIGTAVNEYLFVSANDSPKEKAEVLEEIQNEYTNFILKTMQSLICFTYQYGSRHEEEFWINARDKSIQYLESPLFIHPNVFPGNTWRTQILTDTWGDEEFRRIHHVHESYEGQECPREYHLPFNWMANPTAFYELSIGLGAPYADKFNTLGECDPPEDYGTIGYDLV